MSRSLPSSVREDCLSQITLYDSLNTRIKNKGLKYFTPTGKQETFIKKVGKGKAFICVLSGANGSGKTATLSSVLGNIILGVQSEWFNHPLFRNWPFPKLGRIGSNPANLNDATGGLKKRIEELWPKDKYKTSKQGKQYESLYRFDNGWVVDVMSYDQRVKEWESGTLGWVLFDEPPPKAVFDATIARMRKGGIIFIDMTPLDEAGYLFDELIETESILEDDEEIEVVYMDIEDSCIEHGVRGYLEHKHIQRMVARYDPDEREARIHGHPSHRSGRIYKTFNTNIHVVNNGLIPKSWPRVQVIDPHDARPFAIGWYAFKPNGDIFCYDEFPEEKFEHIKGTNLDYKDYATIIRMKEGRDKISKRFMDPNFGRKKIGLTLKTVQEEMEEFGFEFDTEVNDDLINGHNLVREWLKYNPDKKITQLNHPKFAVLNRCRNHKVSFLRYGYKKIKTEEVRREVPLNQTYKHFMDLVRYLASSEISYADLIMREKPKESFRLRGKSGTSSMSD